MGGRFNREVGLFKILAHMGTAYLRRGFIEAGPERAFTVGQFEKTYQIWFIFPHR